MTRIEDKQGFEGNIDLLILQARLAESPNAKNTKEREASMVFFP
jgi:hypothetical protein